MIQITFLLIRFRNLSINQSLVEIMSNKRELSRAKEAKPSYATKNEIIKVSRPIFNRQFHTLLSPHVSVKSRTILASSPFTHLLPPTNAQNKTRLNRSHHMKDMQTMYVVCSGVCCCCLF